MSKVVINPKQEKRLIEAQEKLGRIEEKLATPAPKKHGNVYSTAGKWQKTSNRVDVFTREGFSDSSQKIGNPNAFRYDPVTNVTPE